MTRLFVGALEVGDQGFVHNTYGSMTECVQEIAASVEPGRTLFVLLGWDGPYYRSGLRLSPSPDLGSAQEFGSLLAAIKNCGGRSAVFSPLTVADTQTVQARGWQDGILLRPWGAQAWCDWTDWNGDLQNEPSPFMNLGFTPFREFMLRRLVALKHEYGVDGVYFDITNYWEDDPRYDYFSSVGELVQQLRASAPDFLVCAENWYDMLLGLFPMFAEPGNIMGPNAVALRYCRSAAYIACPSPSGDGGVHEKGRGYLGAGTLQPWNIPYLAVTHTWRTTLQDAREIARRAMQWRPPVELELPESD